MQASIGERSFRKSIEDIPGEAPCPFCGTPQERTAKEAFTCPGCLVHFDFSAAEVTWETRGTTSRKITKRDKLLFEHYLDVWELPLNTKCFWPAVSKCVAQALRQGYTYDELRDLIEVSKHDKLLKGRPAPALHELLSGKMIARLNNLLIDFHKMNDGAKSARAEAVRQSLIAKALLIVRANSKTGSAVRDGALQYIDEVSHGGDLDLLNHALALVGSKERIV